MFVMSCDEFRKDCLDSALRQQQNFRARSVCFCDFPCCSISSFFTFDLIKLIYLLVNFRVERMKHGIYFGARGGS